MYRIKQFHIEQLEQRKTIMCTQHPIEEPCKLDPPWEGPQVIPAQLRRVDNLIFRRLNQFSRANGVEQTTPMHGWIIEYLYRHRDEPVFQRDIEREFSILYFHISPACQISFRSRAAAYGRTPAARAGSGPRRRPAGAFR